MERKTEIQMEASLTGVDHAVSIYVRRKFVSVKGFVGSEGTAPLVRNLGAWWLASGQLQAWQSPTPPHSTPAVTMNWWPAVSHSQSGRVREQINNLSPHTKGLIWCGVENMDSICLSIGVKEFTVISLCIAARMSEIINFFWSAFYLRCQHESNFKTPASASPWL